MSTGQYWGIFNGVMILLILYMLFSLIRKPKNTENRNITNEQGSFETNLVKKPDNVENKGGSLAEGVMGLREQLSYHERQCANRHEEFMRQLRAIGDALGASKAPPATPQQD